MLKILKEFGHFLRVHLVHLVQLKLIWQNLFDFGQVFIDVNDEILKYNPTISSHWSKPGLISSKNCFNLSETS